MRAQGYSFFFHPPRFFLHLRFSAFRRRLPLEESTEACERTVGVLDADGGRCRCMRAPNHIRRRVMATYIVLNSWTQRGIEQVKESPARLDAAKQAAQAMGAEIKAFYLVMGRYDMVIVAEAPDDETVAKLALATGAQGTVRTETLRAFTEDEYRKIIGSLP